MYQFVLFVNRLLFLKCNCSSDEMFRLPWKRINSCKHFKTKQTKEKHWQGCGEIGTLGHCWWECKMVELLWKTVWRFLKKFKIELSYDPAISLVVITQKN